MSYVDVSKVHQRTAYTIPGTLAVAASDFGWGSLGKLRLILDELTGVNTVTHPDSPTGRLSATMMGEASPVSSDKPADAALVVNDPTLADHIAASHVPVIYVDSLPYLRHSAAEVAGRATVYCAQRWPGQTPDPESPLARITDVRWVDPIVPRGTRRTGGAGTVINVGGLSSHLSGEAPAAYLRTVLVPLVESLVGDGRRISAVCGRLPDWARAVIAAKLPADAVVGAQTPYEFDRTLRAADTLITSPGSTTILQAGALGLPTMLLPPQNLSQILNTEIYSDGGSGVATWPAEMIDRQKVDVLRSLGEDAVIDYIYSRIIAAGKTPRLTHAVRENIRETAASMPTEGALRPELKGFAFRGASQVARCVRQILLAPPFHPRQKGG